MTDAKRTGLIVVGGGLAGLTAAVRASELGLPATVLEQGEDERYLCNSRLSGGIFHVAYNEMKAGADALMASIRKETDGDTDEALARTVAAEAGRTVDWLREHGARFIHAGSVPWERWLLAPPRPLRAGLEWQGRGPDAAYLGGLVPAVVFGLLAAEHAVQASA
jgi:fumarate reductase flavoprotein subunit